MAGEQTPALKICDRWDAGMAIATVEGEIDFATVGIFTDRLRLLALRNPQQLVIDLAGVSFVDSSGLGGFVRLRKILPPECQVVLRLPQRQVRHVFKITGLDSAFVIE